MALSAKSRAALFEAIGPLATPEATEEMLAYFPAGERDEPATRDGVAAGMADLRTEMAGLGGDLRTEMADLRTDLRGEMADLRTELRDEMADLRTELKQDMADLSTGFERSMRHLAMWMTGSIVTGLVGGMGVVAAIT